MAPCKRYLALAPTSSHNTRGVCTRISCDLSSSGMICCSPLARSLWLNLGAFKLFTFSLSREAKASVFLVRAADKCYKNVSFRRKRKNKSALMLTRSRERSLVCARPLLRSRLCKKAGKAQIVAITTSLQAKKKTSSLSLEKRTHFRTHKWAAARREDKKNFHNAH